MMYAVRRCVTVLFCHCHGMIGLKMPVCLRMTNVSTWEAHTMSDAVYCDWTEGAKLSCDWLTDHSRVYRLFTTPTELFI